MTKFYYKTLLFENTGAFKNVLPLMKIEEELNRLGELGWELASTTVAPSQTQFIIIMKNTENNLSG